MNVDGCSTRKKEWIPEDACTTVCHNFNIFHIFRLGNKISERAFSFKGRNPK